MKSNGQQQPSAGIWDSSYGRRENFVFSPSDEVVRFVSRYLRRRVGLDEIVDIYPGAKGARVIDIGCGIGRNMIFGTEMGLEMHGNDLSAKAVEVAKDWLASKIGPEESRKRLVANDIRKLPWPDKYFAHAISDSALDSMPFEIAQEGLGEIARLVRQGGLFYCNFISGDETGRDPNFNGEEIVNTTHENGTIQSYFNSSKIHLLLEPQFEIISCELHQVSDPVSNARSGRWHVVARCR
jgi:ubiquinone/menaquinone biosynthesis C-methylase UbiE